MKFYLLLALCFAAALAEKKVNLEDIEKDNLRAEAKTEEDTVQSEETKYSGNVDSNKYQEQHKQYQHPSGQYQVQSRIYQDQVGQYKGQAGQYQGQDGQYKAQAGQYQGQDGQYKGQAGQYQGQAGQYQGHAEQYQGLAGYATGLASGPQSQSYKYVQVQPEAHSQGSKYYTNELAYQHQQNAVPSAPVENVQAGQYYTQYYQQPQKNILQASYEQQAQQQLVYKPEVLVGNQVQSVQQKAANEKYTQTVNKDVYLDIPASQLYYYPGVGAGGVNPQVQQPVNQKIPTPAYNEGQQSVAQKLTYQVQPQASRYTQPDNAAYTAKALQNYAYVIPEAQRSYSPPQAQPGVGYPQQSFAYPQQEKYAYTQAYFPQVQAQYVDPGYNPGSPTYAQINPVYTDAYASGIGAPAQDNSLAFAQGQFYAQPQQFYVPSNVAEELAKHFLQQQGSQSVAQNYAKYSEVPQTEFIPPQLAAQNFKSSVTQQQPISAGSGTRYSQKQVYTSGAKSLLDSYVPSGVIAAQNSARYREIPLKLEGGFLPSKGVHDYSHKKRKSN